MLTSRSRPTETRMRETEQKDVEKRPRKSRRKARGEGELQIRELVKIEFLIRRVLGWQWAKKAPGRSCTKKSKNSVE